MTDDNEVPGSPGPDLETPASTADTTSGAPAPVLKTRWRDRAWSFRAMLGVALASLVLGGIAGGVVGAVANGEDDGHPRIGRWGPGMDGPPGLRGKGPRHFGGHGGPGWRWDDGPGTGPAPYGSPAPQPRTSPTPTPSG
jgi:hypothetical protein